MKARCFVISIFLIFYSDINAKISKSSFTNLLKESVLIIKGSPMSLSRDALGAGSANFTVAVIYKGKIKDKIIKVSWGSTSVDQRISCLYCEYILYLIKGPKGKYIPTQAANSFWRIDEEVQKPKSGIIPVVNKIILYDYPVSEIEFDEKYKEIISGNKKYINLIQVEEVLYEIK